MKKFWNFVSNEEEFFGLGVDLIVFLFVILLVMLVIIVGFY